MMHYTSSKDSIRTQTNFLPPLLAASVLLAGFAGATEYRASSAAAIERVSSAVRPGDTVTLTNGLWTDAQITFRAEGSESKPIILRGESPGKVTLSGNSWLRIAGYNIIVQDLVFQGCTTARDLVAFHLDPKEGATKVKKSFSLVLKAHHCRLTNCAFLDCDPGDPALTVRWVSLFGSHNRVDHCLMRGKTGPGAMVAVFPGGETPDHLIDTNNFALRERTQGDANETLLIGNKDTADLPTNVTVESNLFQSCSGGDEIISNRSSHNTYRHNTFRFCEGALSLRTGANCVVDGNYMLGASQPRTGGVVANDSGHQVINNYFAELQGTSLLAPVVLLPPSRKAAGDAPGTLIGFNTIVNCAAGLFVPEAGGPGRFTIANNIFSNIENAALDHANGLSQAVWQANIVHTAKAGAPPEKGVLSSDPKLVFDKDRILRPAADSPAKGAAEGKFAEITKDIDGQPRPDAKDIGCDQGSNSRIERPLLAAEESGASWLHRTVADHRGERGVSREREVQE